MSRRSLFLVGALLTCGIPAWAQSAKLGSTRTESPHRSPQKRERIPALPTPSEELGPYESHRSRARQFPLEIGPDFGVAFRPAKDNSRVSYSPSYRWGLHATIELNSWLNVRMSASRSAHHAVHLDPGALSTPDSGPLVSAQLSQSPIKLWLLGLRLEPTWQVLPRWRVFSGIGAGWATLETSAITGSIPGCMPLAPDAGCNVVGFRRTGALVELTSALGTTLEIWPKRLLFLLNGAYSVYLTQSGTIFGSSGWRIEQVFAGGQMFHLAPLPQFKGAIEVSAGLGLIL